MLSTRSYVSSVGPSSVKNEEESSLTKGLRSKRQTSYSVFRQYGPTFLYFDLYLNTAYAAHYVYFTVSGIQYLDSKSIRIQKVFRFKKYSDSKSNRIPKVYGFQKYPDSKSIRIPKVYGFQKYPDSKSIRIPKVSGFQKYLDSKCIGFVTNPETFALV